MGYGVTGLRSPRIKATTLSLLLSLASILLEATILIDLMVKKLPDLSQMSTIEAESSWVDNCGPEAQGTLQAK